MTPEMNKKDTDFDETEAPWRPQPEDELQDQPLAEAEGEVNGRLVEGGPTSEVQADLHLEATVGGESAAEVQAPEIADRLAELANEPESTKAQEEPARDEGEITTLGVVEAVLFATDEPITPQKLVEIVGTGTVKEMRDYVQQLNDRYEQTGCSFRVEAIAGGYQMLTQPRFNVWLKKLLKVRSENKLSPAALETLAIIAYKQPIIRVDIEAIRGVACGEMVRQLSEKGLVKIVGRAEVLGRPMLYGTTKKFLEVFGLNTLKDLPTVEDLKKPE